MLKKELILFLTCSDPIGSRTVFRMLEMHDSIKTLIDDLSRKDCDLTEAQILSLRSGDTMKRYDHVRDVLEDGKIRFVTYFDDDYPDILRHIPDPPPGLFITGSILHEDAFALAVVGTRDCDSYGRSAAADLCSDAARLGITLVSGLARGIDTVCHRTALEKNSRTIAVLGTAIDRIYPAENKNLAERIRENGAVISELAPGSSTIPSNFIRRNRIISGLSRGVVVVQAGDLSGALATAYHANEQNREVFSVPGPVDSGRHRGCHRLIKEGAKLAESFDDIISEFPSLRDRAAGQLDWINESSRPAPLTDPSEKEILEILKDSLLHIDGIKHSCGLPLPKILSSLLNLELKGYVRQLPGKYFKRII